MFVCGLVLVTSVGCTSSGRPALHATGTSTSPAKVHVVGLGDSVPAASGCDCTSFVVLYGRDVERHVGRPAVTTNLARGGLTSAGLLEQLSEPAVERDVADADLVTVTIGANDFVPARDDYFAGTCGGADGLACVRAVFGPLDHNLASILDRIHRLADGHPVGVRVTNYWNVFEAGENAVKAYGTEFPAQSDRLTQEANRSICAAAKHAEAPCIDVYAAFKRATPSGDPTALLAPDGDHPNQAGHDLIASTIAAAGFAPLQPAPR